MLSSESNSTEHRLDPVANWANTKRIKETKSNRDSMTSSMLPIVFSSRRQNNSNWPPLSKVSRELSVFLHYN